MKPILTKSFSKFSLTACLLITSFFLVSASKGSERKYHPNPVIGTVDGNPVTFEDIRNKKINDLSLSLFQHLNMEFIEYSLKKLEPKYPIISLNTKEKISINEIISFYEINNLKDRGTLEQLKPQIRQYLERQNKNQHLLKQYSLALKKGWVISNLEAPSKFFIKGNVKTAFIRGNKKASVILIEFSDYQCPFCKKIQPTINKLIENYSDRVAFGYRHFPLSFHKEADEAAISSECAREQGKFEEMHSLLYSNKNFQNKSIFKKLAKKIKIKSIKKFERCIDNEKYRGLVNQDLEDATKLGITGTPGFFLGNFDYKSGEIQGEILSGALPYDSFQKSIEKYLKANL